MTPGRLEVSTASSKLKKIAPSADEVLLPVTAIERFSAKDGPGIRTVVFLKGCPLRCLWCHNPETQSAAEELLFDPSACIGCGRCAQVCPAGAHTFSPVRLLDRKKCVVCGKCAAACPTGACERSGRRMSVEEILTEAKKDEAFYAGGGGLTLSGGEPLFFEGSLALLKRAKESGLSVVAETCGYLPQERVEGAAKYVDLFYWDVKDTCEERHFQNTGGSFAKIRKNLLFADELGCKTLMRCIMVEGEHGRKKSPRHRGVIRPFKKLLRRAADSLSRAGRFEKSSSRQDGRREKRMDADASGNVPPADATPRLRRRDDRVGSICCGKKAFVVDKFPVCPALRQVPRRIGCIAASAEKIRNGIRAAARLVR